MRSRGGADLETVAKATCLLLAVLALGACGERAANEAAATKANAPALEGASKGAVPRIDGPLRARLVALHRTGLRRGARPAVFAKIGDSITESGSFLQDIGCGGARLGRYGRLASTVSFFRRTPFPASFTQVHCGVANSFTRASIAATAGWDARDPLRRLRPDDRPAACAAPDDRPLPCELRLLRPSVALVMYGTNDLERYSAGAYRKHLRRVVQALVARGVIPVLFTVPPRRDSTRLNNRVPGFNAQARALAAEQRVPLVDYHLALTAPGMVDQGMDEDGIHPSVLNGSDGADLTDAGLRRGYNRRNLLSLLVLDELRRHVF